MLNADATLFYVRRGGEYFVVIRADYGNFIMRL